MQKRGRKKNTQKYGHRVFLSYTSLKYHMYNGAETFLLRKLVINVRIFEPKLIY